MILVFNHFQNKKPAMDINESSGGMTSFSYDNHRQERKRRILCDNNVPWSKIVFFLDNSFSSFSSSFLKTFN